MSMMYGGTEGSSGSDASRNRADREAVNGTAVGRQRMILADLAAAGPSGRTWRELSEAYGLHHGQITGSLSNLHKNRRIARLTDKRGRCSIYVLPAHVGGRTTVPQGRVNRALAAEGYPHRQGPHLVLGPDVLATLDGESIMWHGRRYHPVDAHDPNKPDPADQGQRPLFDLG